MSDLSPPHHWTWDVLLLVFEHADVSTLAILGRVSFDFLTVTAPKLYKEVRVKESRQLEKLFCERKEEDLNPLLPSRINAFLSLSQIRSLTLDFASLLSFPMNLQISSSRFDSTNPLLLDNLQINYQDGCGDNPVLQVLYSTLLPHLNPVHCTYHAFEVHSEDRENSPWTWLGYSRFLGWSRLTQLDLYGLIPHTGRKAEDRLAGLSLPSLLQRLQVRLHVASMVPPCDEPVRHWDELLSIFGANTSGLGLGPKQVDLVFVVLVVPSEEQRRELKDEVRVNERIARWRSVLAVELEL